MHRHQSSVIVAAAMRARRERRKNKRARRHERSRSAAERAVAHVEHAESVERAESVAHAARVLAAFPMLLTAIPPPPPVLAFLTDVVPTTTPHPSYAPPTLADAIQSALENAANCDACMALQARIRADPHALCAHEWRIVAARAVDVGFPAHSVSSADLCNIARIETGRLFLRVQQGARLSGRDLVLLGIAAVHAVFPTSFPSIPEDLKREYALAAIRLACALEKDAFMIIDRIDALIEAFKTISPFQVRHEPWFCADVDLPGVPAA